MRITLGKTGLKVNPVGFGGIPIQRLGRDISARLVEAALDRGVNFFDTARVYSDSEEKMGQVFGAGGHQVIIATKSMARSRDLILRDIETSLKKLRVNHIDLYQCHNISSPEVLDKVLGHEGAARGLVEAREQGMIRHIGVTGHKPWVMVEALKRFPFETVQIPFNYIETASAEELLPLAQEKQVGTIAMKPLAGGALRNVVLNLRFILTSGIDAVIPGMDNISQVEENLSVLGQIKALEKKERALLDREKTELGDSFCRRCEYCMPCPEGLNIPFLHLIGAYYFRYGLKKWAWERLQGLEKNYRDCVACGECRERCPYDLDMPVLFQNLDKDINRDYRSRSGYKEKPGN